MAAISSLITSFALALAIGPASDAGPVDDPPPPPAPLERTAAAPGAAIEGPSEDYVDPLVVALTPVAGGITADEVARDALRSAPTIGIRSAELQLAAARVDMTMVSYLPTVQGSFSYSRVNKIDVNLGGSGSLVGAATPGPLTLGTCPDGTPCVVDSAGIPVGAASLGFSYPVNFFSLNGSLSVPISDYILSLLPARRSTKASVEAARLAREAEIIKVEADARIAYYNWLRTVAMVVVAEASIERSKARLSDAEASFEAGVASRSDVLRLDSLVASTETSVAQARAVRDLAARHLALMMNRDDADFSVGEDVLSPPKEPPRISELKGLIDEAHSQRLELRSLQRNASALRDVQKIYRAGYFPRLDGTADGTYANPNQRYFPLQNTWNPSWSAGARLSYSLGQAMRARAQIRESRADSQKLTFQEEQLRRAIALEVTQAFLDRQQALVAIELSARAVRSSDEAYRVATDLFQAGTATTTDIIDAELARVNATLQQVNARIDLRVATLKILYSTGRLEPIERPT